MTEAAMFADHALSLQWHALSPHARECARMFLLDTLAVGVAGAHAAYAGEILRVSRADGGARVLGRGTLLPPGAAAFANAYQIHAQEFDCVHESAVLHPMSALLGAMVAECTAGPAIDGETFGAAMVAGVDIAVSLGLASRGAMKFFRPAIAGIFGATAAIARLRGLSHAHTVAAFGHALAFASGTMQAHVEGTPGLALQVAAAARNALLAADLAQAGIPAAQRSVEGPFGYFAVFEQGQNLAPVLAAMDDESGLIGVSQKPFPTGRAAHGAIFAMQMLAGQGIRADDISSLRYIAPPLIARLVGRPARPDMSVAYARLCLPYLVATTARHGTVGLAAFSPMALADTDVLALAGRACVQADDHPDATAFVPARLEARLNNGRFHVVPVDALPGSVARPLDAAARQRKCDDCFAFAGMPERAAELAARVEAFEAENDMAQLFRSAC